jgi:membrane fusion protein (multidrug efflux system)
MEYSPAQPAATIPAQSEAPPAAVGNVAAPEARRPRLRRAVLALAAVAACAAAGWFLYPRVILALTTVSTDDAYVNAHVTQVAPRIAETVVEVRVDDNDYVAKGDLLVRLDDRMSKVRAAEAAAALEVARRNVDQAEAKARATLAEAKANRFKLASAVSGVRNQAAGLRATVAQLRQAEAAERLAKAEADRYAELARRGSITREQADVRLTDIEQARARTSQARAEVHRARAALELPEEPADGKPLDDVPEGLEQKHSSVVAALGALALSLAQVGLPLPRYYATPDEFIAEVRKTAPDGDIDKLVEQTVARSPGVEAARAQVGQAEQTLAQARLELSYCEVHSDIEGFVSNRNVNPGDRVTAGQRLMAVRSFRDVWVDVNLKETQLEPVRIGQPVDLYVDAYPGQVFRGRVSGFSPGTGASTALFPAQNATGNFVKIVQRLPVRIDLVDGNPPATPLFVGLSVEPYIRVYERPTGPHAGQRLRGAFPAVDPDRPPLGIAR